MENVIYSGDPYHNIDVLITIGLEGLVFLISYCAIKLLSGVYLWIKKITSIKDGLLVR